MPVMCKDKEQKREYLRQYYQNNKERYRECRRRNYLKHREKEIRKSLERQNRHRKLINNMKQNIGCSACDYNGDSVHLVFHHTNPAIKDFGLGKGVNYGIDRLLEEANKCIVLCKSCHGRLHRKMRELGNAYCL